MLFYLKKIVDHSIIYGISNSLVTLVSFILLPVYARFLSPQEYGMLATINISGGILGIIYDMGLIGALNRRYFDYSESENLKRKTTISTVVIFYFVVSSIATIILCYFSKDVSNLLFKGQKQYFHLIQLMAFITYLNLLLGVPLSILRLKEKAIGFTMVSIIRVTGILFLTLLYLGILKEGLLGVYKSQLMVCFLVLVVAYLLTFDNFKIKFSFLEIKWLLSFGLMYLPTIIFTWIINFSDRFFLNYFLTLEEVGVYSFGYKIGQVVYILVISFFLGWNPILFSIIKEDNSKEILATIMTYFFLVLFSFVLLESIFSSEIVTLLSVEEYKESYKIVSLIAFSYLLFGIYCYLFSGLLITNKIKSQPIILGISALINVLSNIILIPIFGFVGAGISSLLTYFIVVVATFILSQRYYCISYEKIRLLKIFSTGIFIYLISFYKIVEDSLVIVVIWKIILFFLFFYFLYLFEFFNPKEMEGIKGIVMKLNFSGLKKIKPPPEGKL